MTQVKHGPEASDWKNSPIWVRIQYRHYIRNANSMFQFNPATAGDDLPGCKRCGDETVQLDGGLCAICTSMVKKNLPRRKK
jgi:hypothetical protein